VDITHEFQSGIWRSKRPKIAACQRSANSSESSFECTGMINPPPHFHALYGEHEAQYNIATLDVINGSLPRRAHALVIEWASLHKDELMKNWDRCQVPAPTLPIDPLE
jgi:Domain of unknown function (DUF4160)